ncbi:hypothetical protein [Streptomyces sp. rh34]|uniref:hypothetical protein n=1 Tax=Streptomyces sp. rh34 TaxID=2034272 RepID=UPI00211D9E90|nr:hypothetical protein [Streptomyces sp. rh34]
MTRTTPALAGGVCPTCQLIMEACTCTGVTQLLTVLAPHAGVADKIGRQDDQSGDDGRGDERDETDRAFQRLVQQLVVDGDDRAAVAGRRARRTLQEMDPGYERQPVLILHRPAMADDACGLCHRWGCTGHDCPPGVTALTEQERKDLSDKVRDANKRSTSRPK